MTDLTLNGFLLPSILMGLGIAIDVAIATISRFRDRTMTFRNWTLPVALSHILLPAFGYYGWWMLGQAFHQLGLVLGLTAFVIITIFLYESFCEWIDSEPVVSLAPLTNRALKWLDADSRGRLVMVLAVSMDALWSGPAKAAQAESGGWSTGEVLVSFLIAGVVVAIVAEISLLIALLLNRVSFQNTHGMALAIVAGKYAEVVVLFSFGLLSIRNGFSAWWGLGSLYECIAVSALLIGVLWLVYWRRLKRVELEELNSA